MIELILITGLHKIFLHLHPMKLLLIARADKRMRNILMSRSSKYIWERALLNVPGLPPAPDVMSIPAYVNLLFDLHCHVRPAHVLPAGTTDHSSNFSGIRVLELHGHPSIIE